MKLISSKRFIAESIEDLPMDLSAYIHRFYSWIEYALGQMGLVKYYSLTHRVIDIENHRGELPCNFHFIHSAWIRGNCNGGLSYLNLTGSPFIGELNSYTKSGNKGRIEDNYIYTDIDKGKILLVYRQIPKDDEGYPLIPDNPFLNEALMYYIIYRLALKGVEHPIIKFKDALNMWNTMYPRASNDIEWFTLPELEEFERSWTSILKGNLANNLYIN